MPHDDEGKTDGLTKRQSKEDAGEILRIFSEEPLFEAALATSAGKYMSDLQKTCLT